MNFTKVTSSFIKEIGYDTARKVLGVKFSNGKTFEYDRVPWLTFQWLKEADSTGSYFSENIKGRFTELDVTPVQPKTPQFSSPYSTLELKVTRMGKVKVVRSVDGSLLAVVSSDGELELDIEAIKAIFKEIA